MSFLSHSASIALKGGLSLAGLLGLVALAAAPASAENASVSGAITRISPAGVVTAIAGEMVAPEGMFFNERLRVEGSIGTELGFAEGSLTINAGAPVPMATAYGEGMAPATLKQAVIDALKNLEDSEEGLSSEQNLDAYVSIVKAAAGVDGLE